MDLSLSDIGAVLGCSKAAASRLRSGKYERPGSELIQRYQALEAVVKKAETGKEKASLTDLCFECPRQVRRSRFFGQSAKLRLTG